jgi:hypothetical protein
VNQSFFEWGSVGLLRQKNEGWRFRRLFATLFAVKKCDIKPDIPIQKITFIDYQRLMLVGQQIGNKNVANMRK